jgi:hypothetical protein
VTHRPNHLLPMLVAVLCVGAGGLLIGVAPSDETVIRVIGALGVLLGCVASFQFLVTNKPLTLREEGLQVGDRTYPWDEVSLGLPSERTVKGRVVREFDIDLRPKSGDDKKVRVNSNIYASFDDLYEQLRDRKGL